MKKIAILAVPILLLVVFASECTSNNNSKSSISPPQNNSNIQSNSNTVVQINSDTLWSGTLTYNGKTQIINGNGNVEYDLGPNPGAITIALKKTRNAGTLSVKLVKEGNVVVDQSTSGGQGVISINYDS
jgi:hypothetical protein